jgi:hypothetical protein
MLPVNEKEGEKRLRDRIVSRRVSKDAEPLAHCTGDLEE